MTRRRDPGTHRRPIGGAVLAMLLAALTMVGCGGAPQEGASAAAPVGGDVAGPTGSARADPAAQPGSTSAPGTIDASFGPSIELCERIAAVESRLADLAALELRPTARVTLDIELGRLQAAFSDMRQDVLDARGLDVDEALRGLGYRMDDLALAVEDFRTTSRPREAASHVAEEAVTFADTLAGFVLLVGC